MAQFEDSDRRLFIFFMLVAVAFGAWLRLWQIDVQIFIDDEWHALHRLMHVGYREIFLSFGHADYSIPMTLLFNWMAETIGLSERRMRVLPLLFGLATMVVIPLVLRPWITRIEQAALALLVAISPLLIHFARIARPYALTIPLSLIAVVALWRWWQDRKGAWLLVYVPFTILCAWLHPLTMMFTFGAASWFGIHGLWLGFRGLGWRPFGRIVLVTVPTLAACALLILPPLLSDPLAMTSKAGVHQLKPETIVRAWEFYIGGAGLLVTLASVLFALIGAWVLVRRDRWFFLYWSYLLLLALAAILILDPAWIHHGLVLVRYTVTAQPFSLMLIAIGIVASLQFLSARVSAGHVRAVAVHGGVLAVVALFYVAGPMPQIYQGVNQFANSLRYHFNYDFDPGINPYSAVMEEVIVHDFYEEIAQAEGDWEVVESPWYFESHFNPAIVYHASHQRRIRIGMISGLCTEWTYGELNPRYDGHLTLRNFVFLSDLLNDFSTNRFVVLHRESPFGQVRELPDIEPCIETFRARFGQPWRETDAAVVFRIEAGSRYPGADDA